MANKLSDVLKEGLRGGGGAAHPPVPTPKEDPEEGFDGRPKSGVTLPADELEEHEVAVAQAEARAFAAECKYEVASRLVGLPPSLHEGFVRSLDPFTQFESVELFREHLQEQLVEVTTHGSPREDRNLRHLNPMTKKIVEG